MIGSCERCSAQGVVEKHHMILRSRGGHRGPIATLCCPCHRGVHEHSIEDWADWILRPGEKKKEGRIDF